MSANLVFIAVLLGVSVGALVLALQLTLYGIIKLGVCLIRLFN